jgi:hypothetical protein
MTTVVRRTFNSTPRRDALATWHAIVELLTRAKQGAARTELLSVEGIVASLIADQAPREAAMIVTCEGPRTRIYCRYDDDAIDGGDANEEPLGYDPLKGDWQMSLPCAADDLAWVQPALAKKTSRVVARDLAEAVTPADSSKDSAAQSLVLDTKGFLGS